MSRVEVIGDCTLYLGDSLEILPTLGKVDAVVTDPPYGVLEEAWDDMSEAQLARFTMAWLSQVASKSDVLITFFASKTRHVIEPLLSSLYDESRLLIWNKMGGRVADGGMFYAFEPIWCCGPTQAWSVCEPKALEFAALLRACRERAGLSKGGVDIAIRGKKTGLCYRWEEGACLPTDQQMQGLVKILPVDTAFQRAYRAAVLAKDSTITLAREEASRRAGRRLDVFTFAPTNSGPGRHPTEKPVPLMGSLLEVVSDPGQLILDPFNGSGTTGVACVQSGRKYIGLEREVRYFDIACRRIEEAYKQPRLFNETAPRQIQADIFAANDGDGAEAA